MSTEWIRRRSYQQGLCGVDDQVRGDQRRRRPETRVRDIKETEGRPRPPSDTGDRVPNRWVQFSQSSFENNFKSYLWTRIALLITIPVFLQQPPLPTPPSTHRTTTRTPIMTETWCCQQVSPKTISYWYSKRHCRDTLIDKTVEAQFSGKPRF